MLLRSVDVLDIFVEPFILSGFRLPNQPYSYYYRSLFSLHNETLSIWIHLIGAFVLIYQSCKLPLLLNSILLYKYRLYNCFGACFMLLCSSQAHLLHSRTLSDHIRSFYIDYFGINFYGFTSGIILRRFSHTILPGISDNEYVYYFTLSLLSLYSLSIACFCKTYYHRPYPWSHKVLQCSGVFLVYFYQIVPILSNLLLKEKFLYEYEEKAYYWHLIQFISFILSGVIFIGRIPERFYPGRFDLFGQSHHTFHFTIFLMAYSQSNAVFYDMHAFPLFMVESYWTNDILFTSVMFLLQSATIYLWFRHSRPKIEHRYRNQLKKYF